RRLAEGKPQRLVQIGFLLDHKRSSEDITAREPRGFGIRRRDYIGERSGKIEPVHRIAGVEQRALQRDLVNRAQGDRRQHGGDNGFLGIARGNPALLGVKRHGGAGYDRPARMRGAKAIGENRAGRQALEQRSIPAVAAPRGQCGNGLHDPGGKAAREEQDFRCGRRDARVTTPGAARTACSFGPDLRWGSPLDGRIEIAEERVEGAGGARFVDGAPYRAHLPDDLAVRAYVWASLANRRGNHVRHGMFSRLYYRYLRALR